MSQILSFVVCLTLVLIGLDAVWTGKFAQRYHVVSDIEGPLAYLFGAITLAIGIYLFFNTYRMSKSKPSNKKPRAPKHK
jgi:hypothetical protein